MFKSKKKVSDPYYVLTHLDVFSEQQAVEALQSILRDMLRILKGTDKLYRRISPTPHPKCPTDGDPKVSIQKFMCLDIRGTEPTSQDS
jgi:hypothetical protein